jgi:aminoglycoside phosphotransferase (APT) family kinase protein
MTHSGTGERALDAPAYLTPSTALPALDHACELAGLPATDAQLIRVGSNAVYRLTVPVVARIAPDVAALDEARKQIVVARWLQAERYPAVRAVGGINQPIVVDGRVVTFWVSFGDGDEFAPIEDVARLVRDLHQLPPPEGFQLPPFEKFAGAHARVGGLTGVSPKDREFLHQRLGEIEVRFNELHYELPAGPIHGDASVGNVMLDREGQALLIDLDGFCVGPREWDVSLTAFYFDRLGWHTEDEYRRFVEVYGWDILQWSGYATLADLHETLMTTWMAAKADADPQYRAETQKRIAALRSGASRNDWKPT